MLLVALAAATMALVPSGAAADPTGDVVAGQATWGVKASFRSYVTGPIGQGTITPTGLTVEAGGAFGWPATGGTHDDGAGDTDAT
ncbi:MAG: HtaA domain-containing protein, partial [Acidimicrobiales bacterium]|nr:HtaA domain-containing protein [Acidimicrobiales bacterium]